MYGSCAGCNPVPKGSVGSIPTTPTKGGHMKYYLYQEPSYSEKESYWTEEFTLKGRPCSSVYLKHGCGFESYYDAIDEGIQYPILHWWRVGKR